MNSKKRQKISNKKNIDIELLKMKWFLKFVDVCTLLGLINLNIGDNQKLQYIVIFCDFIITCIYTAEVVIKMYNSGIIMSESAFLRDPLSVYDLLITSLLWLSLSLHILIVYGVIIKLDYVLIIKAPKHFILNWIKLCLQKYFYPQTNTH